MKIEAHEAEILCVEFSDPKSGNLLFHNTHLFLHISTLEINAYYCYYCFTCKKS